MYRAPNKCAVCSEKLTITRLSCETCGTTMDGRFDGCRFCSLSPEETAFLLTFIKNRGSIKDVERDLGVSYPTVRAALDNLISSLGLNEEGEAVSPVPDDTPRARRRANAVTRKRQDILSQLAEHRITAEEAARRLGEL